jgi:hypothetical protein
MVGATQVDHVEVCGARAGQANGGIEDAWVVAAALAPAGGGTFALADRLFVRLLGLGRRNLTRNGIVGGQACP